MARNQGGTDDPIIIKKYANRRLYNTGTSSYITLDDLARMTREGVQFQVVDAKTGDDITHSILTQIIMEEEASGEHMLPVSFLRDLISMYGNSMQAMMPSYLEASMANFRENQAKLQEAFKEGMGNNPFARIAETNMAMMRAATEAFIPGSRTNEAPRGSKQDTEIAALREQMAAMQKKLDELGN
ncbi:polyhydroxyalkanoate synthesis repressor PhaR [Pelagerythrobacter rhizovicinus]|uniref:Polyhydroxyalkanoate synthesis repressor PhaR n=1 Tax=Pelagerythrobacter rhizovicinus TaxID=2268576 RepID=A0A4Q2KNS1_9SPHN|nr:polyhydroxyalkanoate synthesis repressor PhaR [Pelagerythrobacter rhizovicinus]RXZ66117.1 polyhydroxyalkanoate synthesis repressor PhaR [Pelagerythrobacter rhizovicinus]